MKNSVQKDSPENLDAEKEISWFKKTPQNQTQSSMKRQETKVQRKTYMTRADFMRNI